MSKKKYIVLARNKKTSDHGLELDGQRMNFKRGKGSALWVADEGKAKALQEKYPKDIAVTLDQQYTFHSENEGANGTRMDNIHNYTFGALTSEQARRNYDRIFRKPKKRRKAKHDRRSLRQRTHQPARS